MGLDMYLTGKRYLSKYTGDEDKIKTISALFPELESREVQIISCELIYWRKVNSIHNWFVENLQKGEDECREYYVSREKLKELLDVVEKVLETKSAEIAKELLPTKSGFFFGDVTYSDYYWDDLEYTKSNLKHILENDKLEYWDIYYKASW